MFSTGAKNLKKLTSGKRGMFLFLAFLAVLFATCDNMTLGFGPQVDLIPPTIILDPIESPAYVSESYPITGTATDDTRVVRVFARIDSITRPGLDKAENDALTDRLKDTIVGRATLTGERWSMTLNLSLLENNDRVILTFVAVDPGNKEGVTFLSVIVDKRPPFHNNAEIIRSQDGRDARFLPVGDLRELESLDPNFMDARYTNHYQNGIFRISVSLDDRETMIEENSLILRIIDANGNSTAEALVTKDQGKGKSNGYIGDESNPAWEINEKEIVAQAVARGWTAVHNGVRRNYHDHLNAGGRLYFRVYLDATDMSGNELGDASDASGRRTADLGFFCLARQPDMPRIRPSANIATIDIGFPISVQVFDDDFLEAIYVGLMTKAQFEGYPGNTQERLEAIRAAIEAGTPVYNWRQIATPGNPAGLFTNRLSGLTESAEYVEVETPQPTTGLEMFGEFMLVTIAKDKKNRDNSHPDAWYKNSVDHGVDDNDYIITGPPAYDIRADKWAVMATPVQITDRNAPLIVVDTSIPSPTGPYPVTGYSPEENTFPTEGTTLELDVDPLTGEIRHAWFTINGYTLDENMRDNNTPPANADKWGWVTDFKVAWIPYAMTLQQYPHPTDPDLGDIDILDHVRLTLGDGTVLDGVRVYDLSGQDTLPENTANAANPTGTNSTRGSYFVQGTPEFIGNREYTKQIFRKRFDLLGGLDDINTGELNFHYNCAGDPNCTGNSGNGLYNGTAKECFENEAKLFVLYAKDVDHNTTFRTVRLLGQKAQPRVKLYDLTDEAARPTGPSSLKGEITGAQGTYYDDIKGVLSGLAKPEDHISSATFKNYPGSSNLVYLLEAEKLEQLPVTGIEIFNENISECPDFPDPCTHNQVYSSILGSSRCEYQRIGSYFNNNLVANVDDSMVTLIRTLKPAEEIITIGIEIKNVLGITNYMMRTVAVTNTARLSQITAVENSGTFPGGTNITLRAQFSKQVRIVTTNLNELPYLNFRYMTNDGALNTGWKYVHLQYPASKMKTITGDSGTVYESDPSIFLDFEWTVPDDANGILETYVSSESSFYYTAGENVALGTGNNYAKAIHIPGVLTDIVDHNAGVSAYMSVDWDSEKTLQGDGIYNPGKQIVLDAIKPELLSFTIGGKIPYTNPHNPADPDNGLYYYFKDGETITFTLMTKSKSNEGKVPSRDRIRTEGDNPRIRFRINRGSLYANPTGNSTAPNSQRFFYADYAQPNTARGMVFEFKVGPDTLPASYFSAGADGPMAGQIVDVFLDTGEGKITDPIGNELDLSNTSLLNYAHNVTISNTSNLNETPMYIDRRIPVDPNTSSSFYVISRDFQEQFLGRDAEYNTNPDKVYTFSGQPTLRMPNAAADEDNEPYGSSMEYSTNNGLTWLPYTFGSTGTLLPSGNYVLMVRHIDRAGNFHATKPYRMAVEGEFPKVQAIRTLTAAGNVVPGQTVRIFVDFERRVFLHEDDADEVYMVIKDITKDDPTATDTVYAKPITDSEGSLSLEFEWQPDMVEMPNGIYVSQLFLYNNNLNRGVVDFFGNKGENSWGAAALTDVDIPLPLSFTGSNPHTIPANHIAIGHYEPDAVGSTSMHWVLYNARQLANSGVKVFTIPPRLISSNPGNAGTLGSSAASAVLSGTRDTITLTFNSAMRRGMGTIIVKPRECDTPHYVNGEYTPGAHTAACSNMIPIPPVLPVTSYYDAEGVYHESLEDIYNRISHLDNRFALLRQRIGAENSGAEAETGSGLTFNDPALDSRTALMVGPYRLNTQGLTQGLGYEALPNSYVGRTPTLNEAGVNGADSTYTVAVPQTDKLENLSWYDGENPGWYLVGDLTACACANGDTNCTHYVIPDTSSKYVLDYQYGILESYHTATEFRREGTIYKRQIILNIRNALSIAKYRWQEIPVGPANVSVSGDTVTVKLNSPLPRGMRWDIIWTPGALENQAGIGATVEQNWWFWTDGVQEPVIRVDRKSIDHRAGGNISIIHVPSLIGETVALAPGSGTNGSEVVAMGVANNTSFHTIAFRVESETPGATLTYGKLAASSYDPTRMQFTMAQSSDTGTIASNGGTTLNWPATWQSNHPTFSSSTGFPFVTIPVNNLAGGSTNRSVDPGTWLLPNLLRKASSNTANTVDNNGVNGLHFYDRSAGRSEAIKRQGEGNLRMLRSYNRDIKFSELKNITTNTSGNTGSFNSTEIPVYSAGKNYIAATAVAPHGGALLNRTARGYEGVFKTIIATRGGSNAGGGAFNVANSNLVAVGASNNPTGAPSIAGFPVQPASGDYRYLRVMYRPVRGQGNNANNYSIWVSTEIVSPVYFNIIAWADNSGAMSQPRNLFGEVGRMLSGRYGDLTYSYGQDQGN